jgi:hypothetical protein
MFAACKGTARTETKYVCLLFVCLFVCAFGCGGESEGRLVCLLVCLVGWSVGCFVVLRVPGLIDCLIV